MFAAIVVWAEIHGLLVQVRKQLVRNFGHADFRITHGCCVVAVHGSKISLAVNQHMAQRKILRHANDCFVDRAVAVRMVFADHIADNAGGLFVRPVPVVVQLMHGKQHAPVYGFEAVPGIGQCAAHNHAHCVVEVAAPHFLF